MTGSWSGTSTSATSTVDTPPDKDVVLEIDVNGAESIKRLHPDALLILIEPPSLDVLEQRLTKRGDDPEAIERRLQRAAEELDRGRALTPHHVVNDDLDRAVREVAGILERHRPPGGST
jgi:guanylate kinase